MPTLPVEPLTEATNMEKLARTMVLSATARELRLPNKLTIHANQTVGLQLLAYSLELLARVFGVAIEYAAEMA